MHQASELFQGAIAEDFPSINLAIFANKGGGKADSGKAGCKPKPKTGQQCPPGETGKTQGPDCSDATCKKKKTGAFEPSVPGWSMPPAPPAL